jgi:hypothetical protein
MSAEGMVRAFCTKELRGIKGGVSGVEEYIANAGLDLVIMGTWSLAAGQMEVDLLPVSRQLHGWTDEVDTHVRARYEDLDNAERRNGRTSGLTA